MATQNSFNSNIPITVAFGGSGAVSETAHSLLLGQGTSPFTALGAATNGQIPIGSTGADPVLAVITPGTGIGISNSTGSITISSSATTPLSFPTDSGTATPAANALTIAGGTNIGSTGSGSTVTLDLDAALTAISSMTLSTGGSVRTSTSAANTALLQAYDVDGVSYTTFATLTANNTPTMDLSDSVTKASGYIYRAGGTDVPVTDGGTGVSTLTTHSILLGQGTSSITALGAATNGQLPIGSTGADPVLAAITQGTGITVTNGVGSITVSATASVPTSFPTDSGTATPSANALTISGANGITTSGSGSTVTVNLTNPVTVARGGTGATSLTAHSLTLGQGTSAITALGAATNGQIPIGSTGADPVLAAITQGTGMAITNGVGSISLAVATSVPTSFATGSGTATPSANSVTIAGGTGISTTGAGSTVTVTLSTPVTVANGGTGAATLTSNSLLLGNGTSAVTALGAATNGQIPIGRTGSSPLLATIAAGTGIGVTSASGSITVATTSSTVAFLAYLATGDANVTGNGTVWRLGSTTALTEVYDIGSNFNTNGVFTAPTTGKYFLSGAGAFTGCTIASAITVAINSSNRQYATAIGRTGSAIPIGGSTAITLDMDAADTAQLDLTVSGEAGVTDDAIGSTAPSCWISGYQVF